MPHVSMFFHPQALQDFTADNATKLNEIVIGHVCRFVGVATHEVAVFEQPVIAGDNRAEAFGTQMTAISPATLEYRMFLPMGWRTYWYANRFAGQVKTDCMLSPYFPTRARNDFCVWPIIVSSGFAGP